MPPHRDDDQRGGPDAALDELLHYAAADEDEPSVELPHESASSGSPLPSPPAAAKPVGTPEGAPEVAPLPSAGSLRPRDDLEAELHKLGWEIVTGPVQAANGWTATMRRGTTNVPMTGVKELDVFESMVRYAEQRAKRKP